MRALYQVMSCQIPRRRKDPSESILSYTADRLLQDKPGEISENSLYALTRCNMSALVLSLGPTPIASHLTYAFVYPRDQIVVQGRTHSHTFMGREAESYMGYQSFIYVPGVGVHRVDELRISREDHLSVIVPCMEVFNLGVYVSKRDGRGHMALFSAADKHETYSHPCLHRCDGGTVQVMLFPMGPPPDHVSSLHRRVVSVPPPTAEAVEYTGVYLDYMVRERRRYDEEAGRRHMIDEGEERPIQGEIT